MELEQLIEEVLANQSTSNKWKNDFKSPEWIAASNLNKELFGMYLNQSVGCQCLKDLYLYINNQEKKQRIMEKKTARFVLKPGLIMLHGESKQFSQHSSEQDLMYLLSKHPDKINKFERYPENWEEIVAEAYPKKVEETEEVEEATTEMKVVKSNDSNESTTEDAPLDNPRVAELEAMTAQELKALIASKGLEIPQGKKADLVKFILDSDESVTRGESKNDHIENQKAY